MSDKQWNEVDDYFSRSLVQQDAALEAALADSAAAGLPAINVAPNQGKFLHLLARIHGARRILEIGTLGGYSAIWLARALPADGRLVTLEYDPRHAEVAAANLARAGQAAKTEIRQGAALDSLAQLIAEGAAPFDLIFIDADKPNNPHYLEMALRLSRPGTVIVGDNVVRQGEVANAGSVDPAVQGTRRFIELLGANPRLSATALQTVGGKGYDGFALAIVEA
ncbi:O-methyltransferase [Chromobacterium subtsugae]|uniref:O-methyltransferase n=1 Tax=Chromobacterium subtsugae TaxID=251747 RepID=A0ABS7F7L4_9NEIS|nr:MULTISPECIES: O-methyltransferase [Chromobacterium]KUM02200.1 methyltransferase [Chromobacterium subtsugae]KZE83147.1 methyltransferase [Chromobacterium sp. F49]MBW7567107.1 O-methyltransferase [Chromobacterium subtsugae]MBW8286077.1 O-methyltransferase [Chromobacterium subtsugae]OBU86338.1 methyltransferase [Chromobacterium subtsugae]